MHQTVVAHRGQEGTSLASSSPWALNNSAPESWSCPSAAHTGRVTWVLHKVTLFKKEEPYSCGECSDHVFCPERRKEERQQAMVCCVDVPVQAH